jgi:TonB family protein
MFSEKIFRTTFIVSILFHTALLVQNTNFHLFSPKKEEIKATLSYIKKIPQEISIQRQTPEIFTHTPPLKLPDKVNMSKTPDIDKETLFKKIQNTLRNQTPLTKPAISKPDIIAIKKKITLPPMNTDKINNPSYLSYYQIVREKIRRAAYQNYLRTETGEVYVTFVLNQGGVLQDIQLVNEKSSPSTYLRDITMRSIKDATPFPTFPKELDYPELTFNVVISFEIE